MRTSQNPRSFVNSLRNVFIFVLSLCSAPALACKCEKPPETMEAMKGAAGVFIGLVTFFQPGEGQEQSTIILKNVASYKGVSSATVKVKTGPPELCGFGFQMEQVYLVYTDSVSKKSESKKSGSKKTFVVSGCSRTKPVALAQEDLQKLPPIYRTPVN